jgi:hypothetical protein
MSGEALRRYPGCVPVRVDVGSQALSRRIIQRVDASRMKPEHCDRVRRDRDLRDDSLSDFAETLA